MGVVANFRSGKTGRFLVGAIPVQIKGWRCKDRAGNLDVTNTESSGHGDYIAGVQDQDVTINYDVSVTVFPFGTVPIAAGGTYAATLVEDTGTALTSWIGSLIVDDNDSGFDVRGSLNGTLTGKFTGVPTRPTV